MLPVAIPIRVEDMFSLVTMESEIPSVLLMVKS